MKHTAGINGFGRFGQHLLKYWIQNSECADFTIGYINDPGLTFEHACKIILNDRYLGSFYKNNITVKANKFIIKTKNGQRQEIVYTNFDASKIGWIGQPDLFLECSGEYTDAHMCKQFLKGSTKLVLISATSYNADALLIYGHNHDDLTPNHEVVSYGSCTVNAFIPLAKFVHDNYTILDSSVQVIHNVPEYQLKNHDTLLRKICTLELIAPRLLTFLNNDNFNVDYTLIPYTGVSIIDYRFHLKNAPSRSTLIGELQKAVKTGKLKGLYNLDETDKGPQHHKFTLYSAVIIEPNVKVKGDTLYIQAYFDNENSVNRYYDLANYIIQRRSIDKPVNKRG